MTQTFSRTKMSLSKATLSVLVLAIMLSSRAVISYGYLNLGNIQLLTLPISMKLIDYCLIKDNEIITVQEPDIELLRKVQANYKQAFKVNNRNYSALINLGLSHCISSEVNLAQRVFSMIPNRRLFEDQRVRFFRGFQYWLNDERRQATLLFSSTNIGWPFLWEQMQHFLSKGDLQNVLNIAELALDIKLSEDASHKLSALFLQNDENEKAAKVWRNFADALADKNSDKYWWALGEEARIKGESPNARKLYEQGLSLTDTPYFFYERLAFLERDLGNWAEALFYFQESIRVNPDYFNGYLYIGDMLIELGNVQGAMSSYDHFNVINRTSATGYLKKAIFNLQSVDFLEARANALAAIAREPDNAQAYYYLSKSYYGLSESAKAIEALQIAVELRPNSDWLFLLGNWYEDAGLQSEAINIFKQILISDQDFEPVIIKLESLNSND
ncbi:MAG: tetratricopeptide repeat protein [Ardenticatenaceae bacterium]|nr:tetratricopeptide repeat protein [Ardenticatenaceae bacterium]